MHFGIVLIAEFCFHIIAHDRRGLLTISHDRWYKTFSISAIAIADDRWIAEKCFHIITVDRSWLLVINSDRQRLYGNQALGWISTCCKMSRARLFPFVLGALEWNQAKIYSILTMQLSHAWHFAPSGNPPLERGNAVSNVCTEWKRRFRSWTTPLRFEYYWFSFVSNEKFHWKKKPFVIQQRLLLKLSIKLQDADWFIRVSAMLCLVL